jgi:hypothetical protein
VYTVFVYTVYVKNVTLSADGELNAMFREWLQQLTSQNGSTQEYDALMKRLKHVQAGRRFSRDEMNER